MPFVSQAQWRQMFALADRGEVSMSVAKEYADASPPYASLPAYVGGGVDQCTPHWHHLTLPNGEVIRTQQDCHVGAEAMENENVTLNVGWGGRIPVKLDMRTDGDMIHGIATIQFPGVATPVDSSISANWRQIYEALSRGGAKAGAPYPTAMSLGDMPKLFDPGGEIGAMPKLFDPGGEIGAAFHLSAPDWNVTIGKDVGRDKNPAYASAVTALAAMAALAGATNPSRGTRQDQAYAAALVALGLMAAAAATGGNPHHNPNGAYATALAALALMAASAGSTTKPLARAYGTALTAIALLAAAAGASKNPHNPDGILTPLVLMASYPAAAVALQPLALMAASPGGAAAMVPLAVAAAFPAGAALTPLAIMAAASQTQGHTLISGYGPWAKGLSLGALAVLAGLGGAALGRAWAGHGEAGIDMIGPASGNPGGATDVVGAFDMVRSAKQVARADVVKNLHRVVKKSIENPLISHAMQLSPDERAHFALKLAARVYGRAMQGDAIARKTIQHLGEQYKKGSPFAKRALRLMNLGRKRYYGVYISGNHQTDNYDLIGECVPMPVRGGWDALIGDREVDAFLETASGVGIWEGLEWWADRLKWKSMVRNPNEPTARELLLAGRRNQAARYVQGQL